MIKSENKNSIKFVALGGLDERGCNLYCLEINNEIIIFEIGVTLPFSNNLGVSIIIADFSYLQKNKNRIVGLFVSKPSTEYLDGLRYLLLTLPKIPIYVSHITQYIAIKKLYQAKLINAIGNLKIVKPRQTIKIGSIDAEFFATTTSIPGSLGIALYTKYGTVVYTGDFIFDQNRQYGYTSDLKHWYEIANRQKVLVLIADASTSNEIGYTAPFHHISNVPEIKYFDYTKNKRFFLVAYEQDINKIQEFLEIVGKKINTYKVVIHGNQLYHSLIFLQRHFRLLTKFKFYNNNINLKINIDEISLFVIGGNLRSLHHDILKMALKNETDKIQFKKNDQIILINTPISGEELNYAQLLDELERCSCQTIVLNNDHILPSNASSEDIKMLLTIFKPSFFIPVKGLYMNFVKAKNIALETGMTPKQVVILDNGQMIELGPNNFRSMLPKLKLKKKLSRRKE